MLILVSLYLYINLVAVRQIAVYKAEDPDNIEEACMYVRSSYTNTSSILNLRLTIDGTRLASYEAFTGNNTPFRETRKHWHGEQWKEFKKYLAYHTDECHPIQYVDVNLLVKRHIFVYDYLGDFEPTFTETQNSSNKD